MVIIKNLYTPKKAARGKYNAREDANKHILNKIGDILYKLKYIILSTQQNSIPTIINPITTPITPKSKKKSAIILDPKLHELFFPKTLLVIRTEELKRSLGIFNDSVKNDGAYGIILIK